MAWRPREFFLEGELDNTVPGRVTGWMRFAGLPAPVTFDLTGNFHRDIRGAKIRIRGQGNPNHPGGAEYMRSFAKHQTGQVGDITAGLEPVDYVSHPYIEWYGDANGRVVLDFEPGHVEVIGRPIPACESDPISREEQQANMARYLSQVSAALNLPAILAGPQPLISDPAFTHWLLQDDFIIGEARSIEPHSDGTCLAVVRLFESPAEMGSRTVRSDCLQLKNGDDEAADAADIA